jgi:imidazolonepropionase-like amidohydrolase
MAKKRVFVTLNLGQARRAPTPGQPAWLDDPCFESAPSDSIERSAGVYASRAAAGPRVAASESYTKQKRSLAKLNAAGVPIALGDDTGIENTFFGYGDHRELELMVSAGMTPMQVLVAATRTPAALLRLDGLGTVAPGKSADFVVLNANPLENIANTRKIAAVYQRGVQVDRAALRKAWAGR